VKREPVQMAQAAQRLCETSTPPEIKLSQLTLLESVFLMCECLSCCSPVRFHNVS
jgi:hypothetical protein